MSPTPDAYTAKLFADPRGRFLHDDILRACNANAAREALVDTSCTPFRRISYAEFGEMVESAARNLVASGVRPGEVLAVYLANSWEYAVTCIAATLAGAIVTLLNPSYREREVRYQLEASGAVAMVTDGDKIGGMDLRGLSLRTIWTTRIHTAGSAPFATLMQSSRAALPQLTASPEEQLAALPFSSGTTGLPKGVMLSHSNLLTNSYQYLRSPADGGAALHARTLGFLPLYHIYGFNVILNPTLLCGGCLVLMPRFDLDATLRLIAEERINYLPQVPPVMNLLCQAAEQGRFPADNALLGTKSGAAPLAPELARRFESLTGVAVRQGYGMTEASPVTHLGWFRGPLYRPDSIGRAVALTDCRIVDDAGNDLPAGQPGELVMRGPQFMRGYWNAPAATDEALRDGWYWSGDVAVRDADGFYSIVDRRKELIKFKGFAVAPAEVEAVLLEHPAVRDCGVVGRKEESAGEVPCAFIVLRPEAADNDRANLSEELCDFVAERLVSYKQPREVRFVESIPRNPSGKILRKDLRVML